MTEPARRFFQKHPFKPKAPCDCIKSGNANKPLQHFADPHAKNCQVYTGVQKPRRPDHHHKALMTRLADGTHMAVSSATLAMRLGGRKGGRLAQARGTANRFTSESGRKASLRMWKRKKVNRRIGKRLGWPSKYKPAVDRAAIRTKHRDKTSLPVFYSSLLEKWVLNGPDLPNLRILTERVALWRLGYLTRKGSKPFPVAVVSESTMHSRGKVIAVVHPEPRLLTPKGSTGESK